jgi:hypothetical protein
MDYVLEFMKQNNIPETRENYVDIAYMGNPPAILDAEEESALPEHLQKPESAQEEE